MTVTQSLHNCPDVPLTGFRPPVYNHYPPFLQSRAVFIMSKSHSLKHLDMEKTVVGWREWAYLTSLNLPPIKAKIDTGARTSALHAFELDTFVEAGQRWVHFCIHPRQDNRIIRTCVAPVIDRRLVSDSGGHQSLRYFIEASLTLGAETFPIELSLTGRETMRYRLLLGRSALAHRFVVDPALSFCLGRKPIPLSHG